MIKWKFIKIVSFFALTQIIFNPALFAQGLDTDFFNQIKRQTGSTTDRTVVQSPIDDAREAEYLSQLDEQSKRKINAPPSIIENDFNSRIFKQDNTDERDLEQFGYSIFNRTPSMNQIMTGSIPDDYVLGVGDDLIISFKGSREEIISIKVDREGRLVIPSMNPIAASGLSLAEIRSVIKNNVAESLIGTEVFVSVATFRQISVLVAGEVENPSLVRISSLSSPMELLLQVGGVKKTGTLRNIIILRGNKKITVDLYNTIEGSQANITLLRDGDRLI
ncbi:MAG: polysaccharide biosynthesis/export family protein, partial [Emcibacteraceae bacterium]|nr:polysaccharide biosynthesis/export family protein [Emcibacteraceae bacterium]